MLQQLLGPCCLRIGRSQSAIGRGAYSLRPEPGGLGPGSRTPGMSAWAGAGDADRGDINKEAASFSYQLDHCQWARVREPADRGAGGMWVAEATVKGLVSMDFSSGARVLPTRRVLSTARRGLAATGRRVTCIDFTHSGVLSVGALGYHGTDCIIGRFHRVSSAGGWIRERGICLGVLPRTRVCLYCWLLARRARRP